MAARSSAKTRYVGRFAPSPTGPLHFGSLVTAVASYADARACDGSWLLRIEDVDTTRCSKAAEIAIMRQLAAYGFEADGPVARQSERGALYESTLHRLRQSGLLFTCNCSRKMLSSAPHTRDGEIIYAGRCRSLNHSVSMPSTAQRLWVRDDVDALVPFVDRRLGSIAQNIALEVGDFILKRADGLFAYQLAVVVDDALQGVTHVVRGEDLLMNTPRQLYLQRLLGYDAPDYLHVPLVKNASGEKLSKQTLAKPIGEDNALETLNAAWEFLRQPQLGKVGSISQFWQEAAARWSPGNMRSIAR